MRTLMTRTGIILFVRSTQEDKQNNVLTYFCYPEGQRTMDVENEVHEVINANQALWVENNTHVLAEVSKFVKELNVKHDTISINNAYITTLLEEDYYRYAAILEDCFLLFRNIRAYIGVNEWEGNEYHIDVRSNKEVINTKYQYNVFQNEKGEYINIKPINLAFGNKGKEVTYTKELKYGTRFHIDIEELDPEHYYSGTPSVLKENLAKLKCVRISVEQTISRFL